MGKRILLAGLFWFAPVTRVYAHDLTDPDAPHMTMLHSGLPGSWILPAVVAMFAIAMWSLWARLPTAAPAWSINLATLPYVGSLVRFLNRSSYPLLAGKLVAVAFYLLLIVAGLFGTPNPERNLATALVWNLWWPLVVVSVLLIGTAWCAVCPWDALSSWLVRRRWWRRASPHPGLNLRVPSYLNNVWLALLLFIGLTWLEIGVEVTSKPYATALMAVAMLVMAVVFLLVFERKAFCHYACPVGRTLGYYARLAPVAVRPVEQKTCDRCTTLECYKGSALIEPCPTKLVVGRFSQNTFCISCGNCALSCPYQNVTWRLRSIASEAGDQARPQWDGAWFMLALLGITSFHGLTMLPLWGEWVTAIAGVIGENGKPFVSFTLAMMGGFALPVLIYAAAVGWVRLAAPRGVSYKSLFAVFSFTALPLAFAYHLAHNMGHLIRETGDLLSLFLNPLGIGTEPLSMAERHEQMMTQILSDEVLFTIQCVLMVLGFWLAVQIVRRRGRDPSVNGDGLHGWRLLPMLAFISAITAMNLWLMSQDMEMRF
jgi:polyferredoxin